MTWSPYSYDSRDPGSLKWYGDRDPGSQFHINIGTRGPWNGGPHSDMTLDLIVFRSHDTPLSQTIHSYGVIMFGDISGKLWITNLYTKVTVRSCDQWSDCCWLPISLPSGDSCLSLCARGGIHCIQLHTVDSQCADSCGQGAGDPQQHVGSLVCVPVSLVIYYSALSLSLSLFLSLSLSLHPLSSLSLSVLMW